ncbi:MAG: MqnA/MqnD/SBP family protein [Planctomycetota bacterium]
MLIRVGHSPDPDDAFMFYALAKGLLPTSDYQFTHELVDIETLNQRAFTGELELTAVSIHAYAFLQDKYMLCNCGASMGDNYGPMVVAKEKLSAEELKSKTIAIPGKLTSATLSLRLYLEQDYDHVLVPFDEVIPAVAAGQYPYKDGAKGQKVDAGLLIHEGQLTYGDQGLQLCVELGEWWHELTGGLPLPLGANAIRKDLGEKVIGEVEDLLGQSINYGLDNRKPAVDYALEYGRDLDAEKADKFIGMYVNDWTRDFGDKGREAVRLFLEMGHQKGVLPELVTPEFVGR